jgi:hypothetical protein
MRGFPDGYHPQMIGRRFLGQTSDGSTPASPSGEADLWAPGAGAGFQIPDVPQDWFSYPLTFSTLAPNAQLSQTIQIDASADFYLTQIEQLTMVTGTTTVPTAGTENLPLVTILINDGGSNRNLMQSGVLLPQIAGDGRWPHYLRHPRRFAKNSTITITLTSVDGTNTYSAIYINFEGFKTYSNP